MEFQQIPKCKDTRQRVGAATGWSTEYKRHAFPITFGARITIELGDLISATDTPALQECVLSLIFVDFLYSSEFDVSQI